MWQKISFIIDFGNSLKFKLNEEELNAIRDKINEKSNQVKSQIIEISPLFKMHIKKWINLTQAKFMWQKNY